MHAMRMQANIPFIEMLDKKYYHPVSVLTVGDTAKLEGIIQRIRSLILMRNHHYRQEVVYCELVVFLLEFGNIVLKTGREKDTDRELSRKTEIVSRFRQLLSQHCRKEGEVGFYAKKLCITPEYLCRVMKSAGGKPANVWIREARLAEAKILLRQPETTVQLVADELRFADQSSFGKFFKKHTGESPLEYRRNQYHTADTNTPELN